MAPYNEWFGIYCVSGADTRRTLPHEISRQGLSKVLITIGHAFEELRLVTELGGVIALAALLNDRQSVRGKNVIVIVSGGNVEPAVFKQALDTGHTSSLSR